MVASSGQAASRIEKGPRPIAEVASDLGIPEAALVPYGRDAAKIDRDWLRGLVSRPRGRLVLVTAITPTPAGEGKTTTAIGLADALRRLGRRAVVCLREPSLGPALGAKGGGTGGGRARVVPSERIDLHFTGDIHAVGAAHNLLAALLDNHLHWGNALGIDPRRPCWRRVLDLDDRALRRIVLGLGGPGNGVPRESGFDITAASEVMAIFCLARDLAELEDRLGRIVVGFDRTGRPVSAAELEAHRAMTVLLSEALAPNLVQTLEGTPALVHGGPFANIAHGCNSAIATATALALAEVVITEAGFGADLGAEKFVDIKSRATGLFPDAAVLVVSLRALRYHGGAEHQALERPDPAAVARGLANLERHLAILARLGLPTVVALNRFEHDGAEELALVTEACRDRFGVQAAACSHYRDGGAGALALAELLLATLEGDGRGVFSSAPPSPDGGARLLYEDRLPLDEKIRTVAREIYGASDIVVEKSAAEVLAGLQAGGFGGLPVCIAKTPASLSADPSLRGAPRDFLLPVREVRLAAGAGFVVVLAGDVTTMPGLPRRPAALDLRIDPSGRVSGLR
ncbi:MAG: formate--tetrahydrofolate ligase [Geminicoccaceae bacterium]|nr:formate--tetrahydrofolate ligase [Geminicoccaceae bacterium]